MTATAVELLPTVLELVFFGLSSAGLSIVGLYIERFALATVQSGELELGAWAALMGAVTIYLAYLVATDKFAPRVTAVRRLLGDGPESA